MASKRRNMFYQNKKQETTEIGRGNLPPFCDWWRKAETAWDQRTRTKRRQTTVIISMGLLVLVQTAGGAPPAVREEQDNGLKEVRRIQEITGPHGYNLQSVLRYATADGSVRVEKGGLVNGVWVVRGTVTSYKPDGKVHILYYIADNYGFRTTVDLNQFRLIAVISGAVWVVVHVTTV
ncbi:hypothetical protein AAG570_009066 [Ranatra chinensis]|uniref:Uncharacterized protein n=1 Tax=Ranatra chinensis TaxID=642074 RepID=A0ABD0YSR0_9HEMI